MTAAAIHARAIANRFASLATNVASALRGSSAAPKRTNLIELVFLRDCRSLKPYLEEAASQAIYRNSEIAKHVSKDVGAAAFLILA
jgi:hypothetical protein